MHDGVHSGPAKAKRALLRDTTTPPKTKLKLNSVALVRERTIPLLNQTIILGVN